MLVVGKAVFFSLSWHWFVFTTLPPPGHRSQRRCWRPFRDPLKLLERQHRALQQLCKLPSLPSSANSCPMNQAAGRFLCYFPPSPKAEVVSFSNLAYCEWAGLGRTPMGALVRRSAEIHKLCAWQHLPWTWPLHLPPPRWFSFGAACWEPASGWRNITLNPDIS